MYNKNAIICSGCREYVLQLCGVQHGRLFADDMLVGTERGDGEAMMQVVGRMNNIRSRAVEIVNAELICS